jgi:hypothetical protein
MVMLPSIGDRGAARAVSLVNCLINALMFRHCKDGTISIPSNSQTPSKQYFDGYFIGYHTHTKQVDLRVTDEESAHLQVQFTGNFPEGKVIGTFDFKFTNGKIAFAKAELIH